MKKTSKPLKINRETVRTLAETDLRVAQGGKFNQSQSQCEAGNQCGTVHC